MPADPVRSPSSIPTPALPVPQEIVKEAADKLLKTQNLTSYGAALVAVSAAAPKLYAHWAEGRVEAVANALRLADHALYPMPHYRNRAREVLGLEDRTS